MRTARCIELGTAAAQGDLPQEAPCADGWPRCQWSARPREREDCVQPGGRSRKAVIHRPRLLLQRYRWLGEGTRRSSGPSLNRTTPSTAWALAIRAGAIACHAVSVGGGQPLVSWPAASLMTPPLWREATAGRGVPQPWAICMFLPWMRGHSRAHPTAACPQTFSRAAGCHRSLASHALHVTPGGRVSDTQPRPANRTADLVFPTLLLHWAHSHRAALALHRITSHIASHLHRSLHRTCIAHCIAHCIALHSRSHFAQRMDPYVLPRRGGTRECCGGNCGTWRDTWHVGVDTRVFRRRLAFGTDSRRAQCTHTHTLCVRSIRTSRMEVDVYHIFSGKSCRPVSPA